MANKDAETKEPIQVVVGADPAAKLVLVGFNMALNRIELSPEGARDVAKHLLSRADIAEGLVPPPDAGVPS